MTDERALAGQVAWITGSSRGLGRVIEGETLEGHGRPADIARAVEFFVTEAGRHVSGQILRVDGGDQVWPA